MRHSTASSTAPNTTSPSPPTNSTEAAPRSQTNLPSPQPADLTRPESPAISKRTRHERKRRTRVLPRPAISIRGLWEAASPEELARAKEIALLIIEMWIGKTSKAEVARQLKMSPLRVWQLSQQAVSGVIAGLLIQPRTRPRRRSAPLAGGLEALVRRPAPSSDPELLRKEVRRLKQELLATEQVNALLRQFPVLRKSESLDAKKSRRARAASQAVPDSRRRQQASRNPTANERDSTQRATSGRNEPRRNGADPVELGAPGPNGDAAEVGPQAAQSAGAP